MRTLSAGAERFALHSPFRIARGIKTMAEVITVMISQGGVTGRGEGVPYPRYGESIDGALGAIGAARSAIEAGADRRALLTIMPPGAARNAVDCALWDLAARQDGTCAGRPPAPLASALTIGIDTPAAMAQAAAGMADAPVIKIKVDATDPAARIAAVRAAAPAATLIVDPNESWTRDVMMAMRPVLIAAQVALLEQPVAADADGWLEGFDAGVPVCADEAVHVAADLDRIVGRYAAINIKLDKTGGLTAAIDLAAAARARGLMVMTGCMISTSLSIAPALRVAATSDFVDLDGPLWLTADRAGGVRNDRGWLSPPDPSFWGEA